MLSVPTQSNLTQSIPVDPIQFLSSEQSSNFSQIMLDNLESEPLVVPTEPLGEEIPLNVKQLSTDPDVTKTWQELVTAYGFVSEEHDVTTSDGYNLKMFRVNKTSTPGATPVFIQHGLFGDGVVWMLNKEKSLAFVLASAGYDVWLGNNRGNQYCRTNNNINITTETQKWFDFSFFELGKYDAPAQIDEVLKITGKSKLSYIGYSQGTTQMFSALSFNHGGLQDKLNLFIALAPVVELNNSSNGLFKTAAGLWKLMLNALNKYTVYELGDPDTNPQMDAYCKNFIWKNICNGLRNDSTAEPTKWNDAERSAVKNSRLGSNASTKEIVHYAQVVQAPHFQEYNYGGKSANRDHYGGTTIPQIPVEKIAKVPIAYFVGLQDDLADPVDTKNTYEAIPTTFKYNLYNDMDHGSFTLGIDMGYTNDVLALLPQFNIEAPSAKDVEKTIA